tara:strand:- start:408 stop:602 length:195 start_codon:yes stop_codon:yes gene_type:complete
VTQEHYLKVPEGTEIFTGARGSKYFMRNGKKVYITNKRRHRKDTKYTAPRGAFARYLANQQTIN